MYNCKDTPFTAVSGNGYFVIHIRGAVTVTLTSSPSAGDIVSIADYARNLRTNNLTFVEMDQKLMVTVQMQLSTEGQCSNFSLCRWYKRLAR